MKFSIQWLQEWLDAPIDAKTLAATFTLSGLEVESLAPVAGEFQGVLVGVVETETLHPDAKRLHCCQVNIGKKEWLPIVCGGVNVRPGLKVAVAVVGAKLPGGIEIKQSLLRGEPSHGMICSARELGLGEDKEGHILELPPEAPVGQNLRDYLFLNDQTMDIALTANRGDCLSVRGIARESAALFKIKYKPLKSELTVAAIPDTLKVELTAPERCPRYLGRIIRTINHSVQTPLWMQERLRRSGVRSIHPAVDVTNYVMLELGQPLHAFNLENIAGSIQVRMARPGEALTLLDGRQLQLSVDDLVIADCDQPLALAGVMGGAASGVAANTSHLFLESAFFAQIPLSLTARRHGVQTDSSYRFARGVDCNLPMEAMERATQLLLEIVGGQAGPIIEKVDHSHLPKPATILLRREQILRLLGMTVSDAQVVDILRALGMAVTLHPLGWQVQVPSYRYDLTLEVDLIEELGRLHGYQHIPLQTMNVPMQILPESGRQMSQSRLLEALVDRGYYEAITYSFVSSRVQALLDPERTPIALENPMSSDMDVMRTSLWPGLLQALQYNQNRQLSRVRLFETGLCFLPPPGQPEQVPMLGGVVSGSAHAEQWGTPARPVDFFDVKGDIEALLALSGIAHYSWRVAKHPALHPGQCAELLRDGQIVGYLGALHPLCADKCEVIGPVYLFELRLDLIKSKQLNEFNVISKFPGVRRDIAIIVSQITPAEVIRQFILEKAGNLLNNVQIFDVYQGQHIEKGQKSIAFGLTFQDASRTLKDDEIQTVVDHLIDDLSRKFNAQLRV